MRIESRMISKNSNVYGNIMRDQNKIPQKVNRRNRREQQYSQNKSFETAPKLGNPVRKVAGVYESKTVDRRDRSFETSNIGNHSFERKHSGIGLSRINPSSITSAMSKIGLLRYNSNEQGGSTSKFPSA